MKYRLRGLRHYQNRFPGTRSRWSKLFRSLHLDTFIRSIFVVHTHTHAFFPFFFLDISSQTRIFCFIRDILIYVQFNLITATTYFDK